MVPSTEGEERVETGVDTPEITETDEGPYLEIPMLPEDPEVIGTREDIYERIQAEMHHEDKEAEIMVEEMLEALPPWSEVPDLMMETKVGRTIFYLKQLPRGKEMK